MSLGSRNHQIEAPHNVNTIWIMARHPSFIETSRNIGTISGFRVVVVEESSNLLRTRSLGFNCSLQQPSETRPLETETAIHNIFHRLGRTSLIRSREWSELQLATIKRNPTSRNRDRHRLPLHNIFPRLRRTSPGPDPSRPERIARRECSAAVLSSLADCAYGAVRRVGEDLSIDN